MAGVESSVWPFQRPVPVYFYNQAEGGGGFEAPTATARFGPRPTVVVGTWLISLPSSRVFVLLGGLRPNADDCKSLALGAYQYILYTNGTARRRSSDMCDFSLIGATLAHLLIELLKVSYPKVGVLIALGNCASLRARDKNLSSRGTPYPMTSSLPPVLVLLATPLYCGGIRESKLLMKPHAIQPAFS